jgi:S-adenosylmethionine hydrolase
MRPLITLLTDFGTADGYVAEMKGVLFSLAPMRRCSTSRTTSRRRRNWPA